MATLLIQQQAGFGIIGWIVVFAAFYFLKDVIFKKDKDKDKNNDEQSKSE